MESAGIAMVDGIVYDDAAVATVPLLDRGFLLGDAVFETLRAYAGCPFLLEPHIERLAHSARVAGMSLPVTPGELAHQVRELCATAAATATTGPAEPAGPGDAYVRISISRGVGGAGLSPVGADAPRLAVVVRPLVARPEKEYRRGCVAAWAANRKIPAACLDPSIKAATYLPNVIARSRLGPDAAEAVQLDLQGNVVGGLASNVFLVSGATVVTPDLASGCLPGVTRRFVLDLARREGIAVREQTVTPDDLLGADECFFTSSLVECLPVRLLDGHHFDCDRPLVATRLRQALRAAARAEVAHG